MNERIVAVIPIRSLRNGKTRLAPVLDGEAREVLLRQTAERVIAAARHSGSVETVLVVSPDIETLSWAEELGPEVVSLRQPDGLPGLNGAIEAGRDWALADGATAVLSLFADLPFLSADDIRGMTSHPEPVVLGPDRRGEGTNALLLRLTGVGSGFRFAFGAESLARHLNEARRLALDVGLHPARGIGFDLDTPEDWTDYAQALPEMATSVDPVLWPCGACIG